MPHHIHYWPAYPSFCLVKAGVRLRAMIEQKFAVHGVAAPQFGILVLLERLGKMTQVELGKFVYVDKATMVRFLDDLEARGALKREPSPEDRRAKLLLVTPKGRKLVTSLDALRIEAEDEFFAPLTAEERRLLKAVVGKLMG